MRSRAIAALLVLLLAGGLLQVPLSAAWSNSAIPVEHSHHQCCPKPEVLRAAVLPAPPALPCGPSHSCCVARAPAKLPSLPGKLIGDRSVSRIIEISSPSSRTRVLRSVNIPLAARSTLDLSTILRI